MASLPTGQPGRHWVMWQEVEAGWIPTGELAWQQAGGRWALLLGSAQGLGLDPACDALGGPESGVSMAACSLPVATAGPVNGCVISHLIDLWPMPSGMVKGLEPPLRPTEPRSPAQQRPLPICPG